MSLYPTLPGILNLENVRDPMNAQIQPVETERPVEESRTQIRGLLVYQNHELERWGKELWTDICRKLGENVSFAYSEWKFEMLAHPALREIAASEAMDAHFILLAVRGCDTLNPEVREWLDSISLPGRVTPGVLVVLLGTESDERRVMWPEYPWLAQKARVCGMGLIVYGMSLAGGHGDALYSSMARRKPEVQWSYAIVETNASALPTLGEASSVHSRQPCCV